jgi:hypothetical protein
VGEQAKGTRVIVLGKSIKLISSVDSLTLFTLNSTPLGTPLMNFKVPIFVTLIFRAKVPLFMY